MPIRPLPLAGAAILLCLSLAARAQDASPADSWGEASLARFIQRNADTFSCATLGDPGERTWVACVATTDPASPIQNLNGVDGAYVRAHFERAPSGSWHSGGFDTLPSGAHRPFR